MYNCIASLVFSCWLQPHDESCAERQTSSASIFVFIEKCQPKRVQEPRCHVEMNLLMCVDISIMP